ncbi:zf-C2H2_jaz domain-containing protein, partial [Cephalotus follicularis]
DPDAEVIALSPKTLLATNRFVCEICNKVFQRDHNLQLHRRGHNLPLKLRQRSSKEVKKRVYVCPEATCVHHDPSRALGDLTGIKKHFCRKHGEKKWKCDKCSKKYAVQFDWKVHSKICGTREYKCDCGTLFSRRDSFITHRAFCDALAEESARAQNQTKSPSPNPVSDPKVPAADPSPGQVPAQVPAGNLISLSILPPAASSVTTEPATPTSST